jgi:acetate---CoA ligase (ADP-forming)
MTHDSRSTLHAALYPTSIALIGASDNPNKIGGRPLAFLTKFGYGGKVYPINPSRAEVQGVRSYRSLSALPEVPDMAIVAVAGDLAVTAVEECARAGVRVALVMASGFGETDAVGKAKEQAMKAMATAYGMRIVGPNSQGLANFGNGAVASFSTMFIETPPQSGPIGIVSQSGGMSVVPYHLLRSRGIGVSHVHATGNDADVTVCELATLVAADPTVKLLLLYLEGIPDPWNLAEAARIARARGVPVIVLKSGRTAAGQEAARSHTGALASEDRVVDAFLEQHGIWRAQNVNDLVDSAELYLKGWTPRGRNLVAISNSGAICVLTADAATTAGMPMAKLSDATRAELGRILPGFATTSNPIDITAALLSNSALFSEILPVIAKDPAADAFLIGLPVSGAGYDVERFARDAAGFAGDTGKPVVISTPQASVGKQFQAQGLTVFATESEAVRGLAQYVAHMELIERVTRRTAPAIKPARGDTNGTQSVMLNEADSLALLAKWKIPVIAHRLCHSAQEAVDALKELGGPVVVKGCSSSVAHKTELGLVKLNIRDAAGAGNAYEQIVSAALGAKVALQGVIVASMAKGERELMIGARRDPVFGPVILVGDGGKYVEAMPDAQIVLTPFDPETVRRALSRLRIAPLLFPGVRGEPPLDVDAFCECIAAVGRLMCEQDGPLNLDLNPIIVGSKGKGCIAVDAVVYLTGE